MDYRSSHGISCRNTGVDSSDEYSRFKKSVSTSNCHQPQSATSMEVCTPMPSGGRSENLQCSIPYPSSKKQKKGFGRKKVASKKKIKSKMYVTKNDFESHIDESSSDEISFQDLASSPYKHHQKSDYRKYISKNAKKESNSELTSEQSSILMKPVSGKKKGKKGQQNKKISRSKYLKHNTNAFDVSNENFLEPAAASNLKAKKKINQVVTVKDSDFSQSISNSSAQLKDDCMFESGLSIDDSTSVPLLSQSMRKDRGKKSSVVRKSEKKPAISTGRKRRLPKVRHMVMSAVKSYPGGEGISLSSIMKYMISRYNYAEKNSFVVKQTVNWLLAKKVLRITSSGRLKLTGFKLVLLPKGKGNASKKKKLMKSISDYQRKVRARAYSRRYAKQRRLKQKVLKSLPLVYKQRHSCIQEGICRFCARKLKRADNEKAIYWIPTHSRGPPPQTAASSSLPSLNAKDSLDQEFADHSISDSEDVCHYDKKEIKWVPDWRKRTEFDYEESDTE